MIAWVTHRQNFLLRLRDDAGYETIGDTVTKGTMADGRQFRLVSPAGSMIHKPRPRRSRARLMLPHIRALPCSRKEQDDLYLDLLMLDNAKRRRLTRALLRLSGRLRSPFGYGKFSTI